MPAETLHRKAIRGNGRAGIRKSKRKFRLKYALLQSFLLATGDDPEDERADSRTAFGSQGLITAEQVRQLQGLIEETGTDLERVLAYYKISALSEMSEASYRRALELLKRKLGQQSQEGGAHAQN